ncbi:MAG TPA: sigma 54-interacting transcriptional regulator [Polyangia bacterium]|jgi:transcriptional regulator with GAF, ATPase, and Fis domain|nr:sigma 54-interacting transcriptional regulator [Polyangia bacterium]
MSIVETNWDEILRLRVLGRVGRIIERCFGCAPALIAGSGRWIAGPEESQGCALAARSLALRSAGILRHACTQHPGQAELVAPIRQGSHCLGYLFAPAEAGVDEQLLAELLTLCAEEIAAVAEPVSALESATSAASRRRHNYSEIIGRSQAIQDLCRVLDKVVDTDSTVLIQGANGTGKELVARAIHFNSHRAQERFVVQNCSAFNDNLLDSELFGHRRGAFTGAVADKPGLFEIADRGTFFLDEVGDMSPTLQVKLLRVLQEGTFIPVGDTATRRTDVRIIAATHRDLFKMVERGEFREDLYYRINVINVRVPALRERREDIPLLAERFLQRFTIERGRPGKRLTQGCLERLKGYSWPGNVRQLEHEIERLVVLAGDESLVGEEHLSPHLLEAQLEVVHAPEGAEAGDGGEAESLEAAVDALESKLIYQVLTRTKWNKTKAAEQLRISRRNLIRKVDKYKLEQRRAR